MKNIYAQQTHFFQTPTRESLKHLDYDDRESAYELASVSESMPNWLSPELNLAPHSYYTYRHGISAKGKNSVGNSVTIVLDAETIPLNLFISAEGFTRVVTAFHLISIVYYLSYDHSTKLITLNKNSMKVGKFIKLLNPAITDSFLNECVNEWYAENSKRVVNLLHLKASDLYKSGVGPVSCMTGSTVISFWDAVGTTGIVLMYNDRIVARCLLHGGKYYDRIYSYTEEQNETFVKELSDKGFTSIRHTDYKIAIPDEYSTHSLPYLDSFTQVGAWLEINKCSYLLY
jgi:hypothetical protein